MRNRFGDPIDYDGPLCLVEDVAQRGWYTIERADEIPFTNGGLIVRVNGNPPPRPISDADVAGNLSAIRTLSRAIRARNGAAYTKDCAVRCDGDHAYLWSPDRSTRKAKVPIQRARELAALIGSTFPGGSEWGARPPAELSHEQLQAVVIRSEEDYGSLASRDHDQPYNPQCSEGCWFYHTLEGLRGMDWGVCGNPKSHRAGLLTFEHQGCAHFSTDPGEPKNGQ